MSKQAKIVRRAVTRETRKILKDALGEWLKRPFSIRLKLAWILVKGKDDRP